MKKKLKKNVFIIILIVLCTAILIIILINFYHHNRGPQISFSNWVETKPIAEENHKFNFAIASMISAKETWVTYKKLIDYIAKHIGEEASMVLRPSYSDVRVLLSEKKVDVALVCTGTYISCSRSGTIELIAVPEFKNDLEYRCLFVVHRNSKINDIAEMEKSSFAFTDPESNTGCIVPIWVIKKRGKEPKTYFSKIIYTGSHDRSLHAVTEGLVDGAGVDSLVFSSFIKTHPEIKECLRVIWESAPFGPPPIVVPTGSSESMKQQLREIFLSMSQSVQGREILDGIGIERFRMAQPDEYNSAHEIWNFVHDSK